MAADGEAPLEIARLAGRDPVEVVDTVYRRIAARGEDGVWIHLVDRDEALARAAALRDADPGLPLRGVPFAVKDNIDVAGMPTTAGCPDFAYVARATAPAVARLLEAGAVLIGKTNLDQFATGLVGVRSPYGIPRNPFDADYIPGGSSSGSAVAVAAGLAAFALGTDTAGSGRVPAALNNIVGLKPSVGAISMRGVVPACRTLDCVSIFALTVEDAARVFDVAAAFDGEDPFARRPPEDVPAFPAAARIGIPGASARDFFGDRAAEAAFAAAVSILEGLGHAVAEIDFATFEAAAALLYGGPWVVERLAVVEDLLREKPEALHPATRAVIETAERFTALDTFRAVYRLQELRREAAAAWQTIDALMVPTVGTTYTIAEVEALPYELNTRLGRYTNFVNLLDLAAIAVPQAIRADGLPAGVTFIAPAWSERALIGLGRAFHRAAAPPLGASTARPPKRTG